MTSPGWFVEPWTAKEAQQSCVTQVEASLAATLSKGSVLLNLLISNPKSQITTLLNRETA